MRGRHAGNFPRTREIIEFGCYYMCLKRYAPYFERGQMLVILYDDIVKDPACAMKKIFRFLEIDSQYVPRSLNSRPQAGVYSVLRLKLLALRNPILYSYSADGMRLTRKNEIGYYGSILVRIFNIVDRKLLSPISNNSPPPLNRNTANTLSEVYAADISNLETLLNRSLGHWKVFRTSP
jgi:hypothetical protein